MWRLVCESGGGLLWFRVGWVGWVGGSGSILESVVDGVENARWMEGKGREDLSQEIKALLYSPIALSQCRYIQHRQV